MRNNNRSSMGTHGGNTLSRLNEALNVLENRLGSVPTPARTQSAGGNDLSAIRARQSALDTEARRGEELREEMRYLREQIDKSTRQDHGGDFEALRQEMRAMANAQKQNSGAGESTALRHEIAELKVQVAALAREDTIQELVERWGVVEREVAALPNTLASRDDLAAMAERLEDFYVAMQHMPRSESLMAMEDQVRTLAGAIEHLASQQSAPSASHIDAIEYRLDEISRAISSIPAPVSNDAGLDAIENRLNEISRSISAIPAPVSNNAGLDAMERIEARITALSRQFDEREIETNNFEVQNGIIDLAERIDQVSALMKSANVGRHEDNAPQAFEELNRRLDVIAAKFDSVNSAPDAEVASLFGSIDARMAELADRIAENERGSAEIPSIALLENRLEDIAAMLSGGMQASNDTRQLDALEAQISNLANSFSVSHNTAAPVDDAVLMATARAAVDEALGRFAAENTAGSGVDLGILRDLESQITSLSDRLAAPVSPPPLIDDESLFATARAAAEEAVSRIGQNASPQDSEALLALGDDLRALEELARDSDSRNSRTFEAIHDTLLKVVDHLSGLEETVRRPAAVASPVARAAEVEMQKLPKEEPAKARATLDDVPPMSYENDYVVSDTMEDDGPESIFEIEPKRGTLSPAQAAAAAAMAAVKSGPTNTAKTEGTKKEAKGGSLLKSMSQKLRKSSAPAAEAHAVGPAHLNIDTLELQDEETIRPLEIDEEPIDPGAGGSDLSEIMRRVREERAVGNGSPVAGKSASADSGKSDFIAAARRAAQAAAADATVLAGSEKEGKVGSSSSLGTLLAKRRKPLLIGAGAILLALLALPLLVRYMAPSDEIFASIAEPSAISEPAEMTPEADPAANEEFLVVDENTNAATGEETDVAIAEDRANDTDPAMESGVDMAQESSAVALTLADIPEAVGPAPLREAAASGDAKALYVVGDYFTGGVPGQSENDLAEAFKWYQRSADLGYAPAQYRTGNFYEKGFGVAKDIEQAKTWYQLAAEQGNASAMHNLAVLFASGMDGTPDMDSAARWFQKAAELGVKDSQFNLGILAAKGQGMEQDLAESYKWFAIAAKAGDKDAETKRDEVANALRPDQLETARGATELWKQKEVMEDANFVSVPDEWMKDPVPTASAPQLTAGDMKKAVTNIQAILNANGYDAGPVDGMMGGKTREAIKAFQAANGLPSTGDVDPALVAKLLELTKKKS